jgi:HAE1 family hydrophobic/amphiphilic exporter-1
VGEYFFAKYQKLIRWSVNNRKMTLVITLVIFLIGITIFQSRPKEFFPEIDLGKISVKIELPPIASIEKTNDIMKKLEGLLEKYKTGKYKVLKHYLVNIGSSGSTTTGNSLSFSGKNTGLVTIEMIDFEKRKKFSVRRLQKIIRKFVDEIAGAKFQVELPKGGPPTGAPVNVVIQGKDIKTLKRLSREIQNIIRTKIRGAVDIRDNYGVGLPEIQASVRRRMADLHSISIKDIANAMSVTFNGLEVSKYYYGDKEIKVRVKIADNLANRISDIQKVYFFKSSNGAMIHLNELVDIRMGSGLSIIAREDLRRAITVSGDTFGRSSVEVMDDVIKILKDFPLPQGYNILYRGENEERDESFQTLGYAFLGGIILIYIIIVLQLKSFIQPLSILATILLSLVGVSFGLLISNSSVGIMAMFGFVALAGVVVNDAIVLVSYINLLRSRGYNRKDAIIEACETRLRPIFMTTFTTAGGLLPLALALGGPSTEFWVPMAWTIIGGLVLATLQTLIAVPIIYTAFEDIAQRSGNFFKRIFRIKGDDDDNQSGTKYNTLENIEKGIENKDYQFKEL